MGTLNALYLIIGPMGTFLGSTLIAGLQIKTTGWCSPRCGSP